MKEMIFGPKKSDAILTIPNLITLLGFVFIIFYMDNSLEGSRLTTFLFLFLAGCSDAADGFAARRLRQKTLIGSILDPARDRMIMLALLYAFWCARGSANLILAIIFVEAFVSLTWIYQIFKADYIRARHIFGKFRQAGHLVCGGLGVLGLLTPKQALIGMLFFSAVLLKAIIAEEIMKKFLNFFNLNLLEEGGLNGL